MDRLVRITFALRRAGRRGLPAAAALSLAAFAVLDVASPLPSPWLVLAAASLFVVLVDRIRVRLGARDEDAGILVDVEIGVLLVIAAYGALGRAEGGVDGDLYPIVYVLVALVTTFARPSAAALVAAFAIALEGSMRYAALGDRPFSALVRHAAFTSAFAVLNLVFFRAEIARIRVRWRVRLDAELSRMRDAARSYRLLGGAAAAHEGAARRPGEDDRLARSSVEEIHEAVLFALELLRRSLGLHTAMLLWQSDAGTHVRLSEVSTDADELSEGPFLAGDGIIGAVLARRATVTLEHLKPGYKLPYYEGTCPVRTVTGVPVTEYGQVRGVLLVDRVDDRPVDAREEALLESATRYVVRAIQNERIFVQLERAKVEQGKLYRAAEALSSAHSEADVVEAGVKSAREVAMFDFAAVTLFDSKNRMHEVRAVSGPGTDALVGARFQHNAGLCAMVVQNRHPLPYKGDFDPAHQVLFTKHVAPPPMPSILVLPLLVHDRPLGTLVLGAKQKGAFGDAVRPTLEVLASHMAVSLANARMVKKLEELATTDGLTGLLNKRAMLDVAEQKVAGATRFARRLSVLITDIDHFKKVNDTYGHDVGDVVIRGMGEILRRAKRATDAVARFGGEEFVLVCEETDAAGAMLLAERIRQELAATTFHTPNGPLTVTCSVGIATFPEAGRDWEVLFKAADSALYVSKRSGRNRSTAWAPQRRASAAPPPGVERRIV